MSTNRWPGWGYPTVKVTAAAVRQFGASQTRYVVEQHGEVGVSGDDHALLLPCAFEDLLIACRLQAVVADVRCVVFGVSESFGY